MNREDAEEFTQTIESIGSGWWRQIAWADRQGIPAALDMTTREWVEKRIGNYVLLAIPERREAVAELTEQGMTSSEIADVVGVDSTTIRRDKRARARSLIEEQENQSEDRADARSPEEIEQAERDRERREAIGRQVNRLRNLLDGWETITHLNVNPLRGDVLDAIGDFDRQRVLSIEEVIHS